MKTFFKIFWQEVKPLVTLILALLLFIIVSGFGIIANFYFSIKGCLQFKFWRGVKHFIVYWLYVLYQAWECVKYLINKVSVAVDLLGNVTSGELIEKVASRRKETWFGKGDITLSAAFGKEQNDFQLSLFGWLISRTLSKIFEKNHSINAYDKKILIDKFNSERGVKFDI